MDSRGLQGWQPDPFGRHELRYFSAGNPTKLVRDGHVEAYDEPPVQGQPAVEADVAASVPAATVAVSGQPDAGYRDPALAGRATAAYPRSPAPRRRTGLLNGAVALVAVVAVIAFVAVEGGLSSKGGSYSAPPGTDLAAVVTRSAQKTLAQHSADITVDGTVDVNGDEANLQGSGQADFATGAMAIDVHTSFAGTTLAESEITTSQDLYLQVTVDGQSMARFLGGRHWFEIPLAVSPRENSALDNPDWSLQLAEQQGGRVVAMGTQDIGGLNCSEYVVTPTVQAMVAAAQQEWAKLGLSASQTAWARQYLENSTPPTLTVWFDQQRQLACQVDVYMQLSTGVSGAPGSGPSTNTVEVLMTFTHYGAPVTITPPAPSDTISFQETTGPAFE
jgi:hypothetical protein